MKTSTLLVLIVFAASYGSQGQTMTWAEHASPILYNNCVKCHNPNGVAPFELLSSASAVQNKDAIKHMVSTKQMPPWTPNPHYRRFASERILSQGEIDTLVNWVESGAVVGDISKAPPTPIFNTISEIINEDLKIKIPNYTVKTPSADLYRCFVIPYSIAVDKYITDIEVLPGNRKAVHHVLLFSDPTGKPDSLDALDPEPGYTCFGGTGSNKSELMGGWVPGQQAQHLPAGIGIKLPRASKAIIQVHYPVGTNSAIDSTKVLMKFSSTPLRNMMIAPLLNHSVSIVDGPLFIPQQTVKKFHAVYTLPFEASILQVAPHMHLVGKSIKAWGVTPTNDTIPLIDIPNWDFHWQGFYNFRSILKVPSGTKLYNEAVYDNTHNNHHNPDHGTKDVKLGEATSDEMMLVYFSFLPYLSGDENIPIPSAPEKPLTLGVPQSVESNVVLTAQFYDLSPNPSAESVQASFYLPQPTLVNIEVFDLQGKRVEIGFKEQFFFTGHNAIRLNTNHLQDGSYSIVLAMGKKMISKTFIKR